MIKVSKLLMWLVAGWALTASVLCFIEHSKREKAENQSADNQKTVSQAATIIERYIDTSGRNHAVISSDKNKLAHDWYKNGTAISGGLIDTVAQALNIAKKQLQEVTQIATTTQAQKLKAERTIDSLKRLGS